MHHSLRWPHTLRVRRNALVWLVRLLYTLDEWWLDASIARETEAARPAAIRSAPADLSGAASRIWELREALLRKWLRRAPYWPGGHLLFAHLLLATNRAAEAYIELSAAERLPMNKSDQEKLQLLFGRVLLALGRPKEAKGRLIALREAIRLAPQVKEELAACHIAEHEFEAAKAELLTIPESQRTEAVQSMLKYVVRMQSTVGETQNGHHT